MKTLIVYATKYGCTAKCAEILKSYIGTGVDIVSANGGRPNLENYDAVIIGGSVYVGKLQKSITRFCRRNRKVLLNKKLALFASCYTSNDSKEFLETLYPTQFVDHAVCATTVGGEMDYKKMSFVYKKIFKSLQNIQDFETDYTNPAIKYDEIRKLAHAIAQ